MRYLTRLMTLAFLSLLFVQTSCNQKESTEKTEKSNADKEHSWETKESAGYEYKYVENDP